MKTNPYISINKLAEYSQATSARRKSIIKSLKEDVDFKRNWYQSVKKIIPKFFRNGYDTALLDKEIKKIEEKVVLSNWDESDQNNSILALKELKKVNPIDLNNYSIESMVTIDKVVLEGVKVSVNPEVYLVNKSNGKLGAIKFHLAKTTSSRLNINAQQYVATLIKYAFIEKGYEEKDIDNSACISLDIFDSTYQYSPKAYKRTLKDLSACCEEIAVRWDTI